MSQHKPIWVGKIPGDPVPFRRVIRDEDGEVVRKLVFDGESPREISEDELPSVRNDIGRVLVFMDALDEPPTRFAVDWERTNEFFRTVNAVDPPARVNRPVNVSAVDDERIIDRSPNTTSEDTDSDLDTESNSDEDDDALELSGELVDLIEKHADSFVEATPAGVQAFIEDGGDLMSLDGFTDELVAELMAAIGMPPDVSRLLAAGIDADNANKLAANVKSDEDLWLLDPVAIRSRVADGFNLVDLDAIGKVSAKRILDALNNDAQKQSQEHEEE